MNRDVVAHLRCPVCRGTLDGAGADAELPAGAQLRPRPAGVRRPERGPLAAHRRHAGDGRGARRVPRRGHYAFVSTALAEAAGGASGLAVDVGAGTGQHLAAVLDGNPALRGLALDVSKPALRRAARVHERAGAVRADAWRRLPLADHDTAVLLDVFAPRNGAEFHRVLRPDGRLLVVTPEPDHLAELVDALGLLERRPGQGGPAGGQPGRTLHAGPAALAAVDPAAGPRRGRHGGRDGPERLAPRPGHDRHRHPRRRDGGGPAGRVRAAS